MQPAPCVVRESDPSYKPVEFWVLNTLHHHINAMVEIVLANNHRKRSCEKLNEICSTKIPKNANFRTKLKMFSFEATCLERSCTKRVWLEFSLQLFVLHWAISVLLNPALHSATKHPSVS